jgi:hypothetical protein
MKTYVEKCYRWGMEEINFRGIPVERLGLFYFMELSDLRKRYPKVDFTRNNPECLRIVEEMRRKVGVGRVYGVIKRTRRPGYMEAGFRFVPPDSLALEGEEFACGTGSTTAAVYESFHDRLPIDSEGHGHLSLKLLSRGILPVDQWTEVDVESNDGRVTNAWFSHNYVRIVGEGKLVL